MAPNRGNIMSEKYTKNVTISLTVTDHKHVSELADLDRRSLAQYLSIMVEKDIAESRKAKGTIDA